MFGLVWITPAGIAAQEGGPHDFSNVDELTAWVISDYIPPADIVITPPSAPTPEPTPVPPPAQKQVTYAVSLASYPDLQWICEAPFTWDCGWALATIECESHGNANAQGHERHDFNGDGILEDYYFNGLFQVWNGPFDPYQNAVEAHIKYWAWQRGEVARPWPNCP